MTAGPAAGPRVAFAAEVTGLDFDCGRAATVTAAGTGAAALARASAPFDLAILNGRLLDRETGFDGIANVGVPDGRLVAITAEPLSGGREIDATEVEGRNSKRRRYSRLSP